MSRFDDLEAAINNRIAKLDERRDADWVNEMGRKIAEASALLDRIAAQHPDRERDIELEGTVRRIESSESKVAGRKPPRKNERNRAEQHVARASGFPFVPPSVAADVVRSFPDDYRCSWPQILGHR